MNFQSKFPLVKLVDVASITTERVSQFDGLKPYVATADVQDGQIVASVDVDYKNKPSRADISVKTNDVTFARMQSTNKVILIGDAEEKNIFSTGFAVCRPTQKILPKYLKYWLVSDIFNDQKDSYCTGATQKAIPNSGIEKIFIPLPPLPEQERIVRLLDEAESLRAARERANTRMEQFVPALFQEMFGDPVKTEFPIKTLNEVADVVSGIAKGRKFNGQKPVTIDYLRVANVQAGYLDLSKIKTIQALPSEVEELQLRIGDVLLTEGGDFDKLGRGAMLDIDLPNCIHQNHVFRARVNQDYLLPVFFHDYLQTQQAKKYFLSCAKKTTNLASINLTQLRALPVPLPPLALQREFAARVGEARGVQSAQGKSAEKIEALYQSMLSQAFAGEL